MAEASFPFVLIALCVVLLFLPPRYDPAFMLAEWLRRRRRDP